MAAHQRVAGVVEEVRVAEIQRQSLVAAGVDVRVQGSLPAHDECLAADAMTETPLIEPGI